MHQENFKGELLSGHKEAAIEVPFDPAMQWGVAAGKLRPGRRGHRVRGSLNGVRFESAIVSRSRRFFVLVDEELQQAAKVSIGDTVEVNLEPIAAGVAAE